MKSLAAQLYPRTVGHSNVDATIADGRIISEQQIVADGSRRAVNDGGCSGFESASWSQDGRRVFLKSDLNCGGDVQRTSSGVLALVSAAAYVDVQSVVRDTVRQVIMIAVRGLRVDKGCLGVSRSKEPAGGLRPQAQSRNCQLDAGSEKVAPSSPIEMSGVLKIAL